MVKEYVDHERGQAGQSPCAAAQLFRANRQPDWWPQGTEVGARRQEGPEGAAGQQGGVHMAGGHLPAGGARGRSRRRGCAAPAALAPAVFILRASAWPLPPPRTPPPLQWSAKVYETKAGCLAVYNAARPVLAAIHDAPLEA